MRTRLWCAIALLAMAVLVTQAPPAWAVDPAAGLDQHAKVVNRAAGTPEGEQRVVERLSTELNVPAETLRTERGQFKVGWGELSIAHRLSRATGVPVAALVGQHQNGMGWGEIAKAHNLKLGPIVSEATKSSQAVDKAEKAAKADAAKADAAAKADKAKGADPAAGGGGPAGDRGSKGSDHGGGGSAGGSGGGGGGAGGGGGGGGKK